MVMAMVLRFGEFLGSAGEEWKCYHVEFIACDR